MTNQVVSAPKPGMSAALICIASFGGFPNLLPVAAATGRRLRGAGAPFASAASATITTTATNTKRIGEPALGEVGEAQGRTCQCAVGVAARLVARLLHALVRAIALRQR